MRLLYKSLLISGIGISLCCSMRSMELRRESAVSRGDDPGSRAYVQGDLARGSQASLPSGAPASPEDRLWTTSSDDAPPTLSRLHFPISPTSPKSPKQSGFDDRPPRASTMPSVLDFAIYQQQVEQSRRERELYAQQERENRASQEASNQQRLHEFEALREQKNRAQEDWQQKQDAENKIALERMQEADSNVLKGGGLEQMYAFQDKYGTSHRRPLRDSASGVPQKIRDGYNQLAKRIGDDSEQRYHDVIAASSGNVERVRAEEDRQRIAAQGRARQALFLQEAQRQAEMDRRRKIVAKLASSGRLAHDAKDFLRQERMDREQEEERIHRRNVRSLNRINTQDTNIFLRDLDSRARFNSGMSIRRPVLPHGSSAQIAATLRQINKDLEGKEGKGLFNFGD